MLFFGFLLQNACVCSPLLKLNYDGFLTSFSRRMPRVATSISYFFDQDNDTDQNEVALLADTDEDEECFSSEDSIYVHDCTIHAIVLINACS